MEMRERQEVCIPDIWSTSPEEQAEGWGDAEVPRGCPGAGGVWTGDQVSRVGGETRSGGDARTDSWET